MIPNQPPPILRNKTAIVTGGAGGLGLGISRALADAGANIVLASRDRQKLNHAAESLGIDEARLLLVPTNVTNVMEVRALMEKTMDRFGTLNILVTAAGTQLRKPALEVREDEWCNVIDVNLSGTFYCCQAAAKFMIRQQGGRMILLSSLTAEIGIPNIAPYVASKGAIRQLAKVLAVEWAKSGITVNCVGPGRFRTKMTEDLFSDEEVKESFLRLIPQGRAGMADELSGLIVFLASDSSSYITGQSIYVDGGWLAAGGLPQG